jgi:ankyrin repeat protein
MLVQSTCPPEKAKGVIDILVANGADLDAQEADGITALMWAVHNEDVGMIRVLLDLGADPNIKNSKGATALEMARKTGFREGVNILSVSEEKGE